VPAQEWQWPELPFMLLDRRRQVVRAGRAALSSLPHAGMLILQFAARDLLMLRVALPPVKGVRLMQALPNIIEDHLIQDAQTCHIAVDPMPPTPGAADAERIVAVVDRNWFRFVLAAFSEAGYRQIRAVPLTRCLPAADEASDASSDASTNASTEPVHGVDLPAVAGALDQSPAAPQVKLVVLIVGATVANAAVDSSLYAPSGTGPQFGASGIELALARGALGEGVSIPLTQGLTMPLAEGPVVPGEFVGGSAGEFAGGSAGGFEFAVSRAGLERSLATLSGGVPYVLYRLQEPGGDVRLAPSMAAYAARDAGSAGSVGNAGGTEDVGGAGHAGNPHDIRPLPFETLAQNALACRFDLCQFEFAKPPLRLDRATLTRWRWPIALALASLLVAVVGNNVQWLMLSKRYDALLDRQTELLMTAFPKTGAVLDAPAQMTRQLDQLRTTSGELAPNDFLALADALSRSLAPLPPTAIAQLDYHERTLTVTFTPAAKVDDALVRRLEANGVGAKADGNRWTLRSLQ
jgi:general secretion pathway protein L